MADLAIVIPAFKPHFLRATLESLDAQSSKDFALYVGNDGGPEEIGDICADFPDLQLRYHRFPDNLGATSLVQQWNRCVELSSEPWVWLLSDDDVLSADCVETLLPHLRESNQLLRFDTETIDDEGRRLREHPPHPELEEPEAFAFARLQGTRVSFVVEYVFRRTSFDRAGGFVDFPAAWCSDDASWYLFAEGRPIRTMPAGRVSWRASGLNITDANEARQFEKISAATQYLDFVRRVVRDGSTREAAEWATAEERWMIGQLRHVMPVSPGHLTKLLEASAPYWTEGAGRRTLSLFRWNVIAALKAVRGRLRRALASLG